MTNSCGGIVDGVCHGVFGSSAKPEKLIIDTDPGIGEFYRFLCP